MGKGHPIMDMFQIWFGSIGKVNELDKNKFSYYICNWIHVIVVVTPIHFEPLDGLGPLPYNQTHNKVYIQSGV
jgi:hypothetical protein